MKPDTYALIRELHELPPERTFKDTVALFDRHDSELLA